MTRPQPFLKQVRPNRSPDDRGVHTPLVGRTEAEQLGAPASFFVHVPIRTE